MTRPRLKIVAAPALAAALLCANPLTASHAQAPTSIEQIDETIAYAIGMEAVFYGMGPVVMRIGIESQSDADKPYDNAQAPVNQMGHARWLYGPEDKFVVTANNDTLYSFA